MAMVSLLPLLVLFTSLTPQLKTADANNLGVCYGIRANNLPPPEKSITLFDTYKFGRMRIYAADHKILRALNGSNVQLTVGIPNPKAINIAKNLGEAENWFHNNIEPYIGHVWFRNIVVGHNDVINENSAQDVLQAMTNLHYVVRNHGLQNTIKITTEVGLNVLDNYNVSYSLASFKNSSKFGVYMEPIVKFLASHNAPLFIIDYPHTFLPAITEVYQVDGLGNDINDIVNGPMKIFRGIIDAFYSAMEKVGGKNVRVAVGETGWPSAGEHRLASVKIAQKYVKDLATQVLSKNGTALRPGRQIETYVYSLYNENLRDGLWKNFGMFYPNLTAVYEIPSMQ